MLEHEPWASLLDPRNTRTFHTVNVSGEDTIKKKFLKHQIQPSEQIEIVKSEKKSLITFGGHKKAIGLSVEKEKIEKLKLSILKKIKKIPKEAWIEEFEILGNINFSEIDWELMEILDIFSPYGEGNPIPKFLALNVEVLEAKKVGINKEHLLLLLKQQNIIFKGIKFKFFEDFEKNRIDIIFYPYKNFFNNETTIQLNIVEIK
jgi:single-stranded-DNA-specific exonuclease